MQLVNNTFYTVHQIFSGSLKRLDKNDKFWSKVKCK